MRQHLTKAQFLARMAAGRAKAAKRRGKNPSAPKTGWQVVTKDPQMKIWPKVYRSESAARAKAASWNSRGNRAHVVSSAWAAEFMTNPRKRKSRASRNRPVRKRARRKLVAPKNQARKRKARRGKNPATTTRGFVIHAQHAHGPLLAFDGERFSNNRAPRYFPTQAEAVRLGTVLVGRLPAKAAREYRVWVQLDASRAGRRINPSPRNGAAVEQAAERFRNFTGHEPGFVTRVKVRTPKAALAIGKLDGVLYSTIRDGKLERYKHEFRAKSRPLLAVSSDGSQLSVVGGRYEFTEAGIEDR